jgi:hypothetical protein
MVLGGVVERTSRRADSITHSSVLQHIEVMVCEDRQKQSLREGKTRSASLDSNARQKPKGQIMVNGFSLLDTGDDDGNEQEDE